MSPAFGNNRLLLAAIAGGSALLGAGAMAAVTHLSGGGPVSGRGQIERVVHDYVLAHPEIIPEAMGLMRDRETGREIAANRDAIVKPFGDAWIGNPNGNLTIVEYFDYNCGFCRSSLPTIAKLVASDPELRVVFRELPILSDESRVAARYSLVAAQRGKFKAFHDALYAGGPISEASLAKAVAVAGIDPAVARQAAGRPEIEAEIQSNLAIAQRLGMSGTPSWVIGDHVVSAALPLDELQAAIAKARAAAKS
ncbi:MAG: disulfide bond formation protein DsbA [Sphingomonas sp. 28-66-16]|nr:MAG: disulfide bond formation protein DsbA [Sphingomonas sp. 28-66-16]